MVDAKGQRTELDMAVREQRADHCLVLYDREWPIAFEGDGAEGGDPMDYRYVVGVPICWSCHETVEAAGSNTGQVEIRYHGPGDWRVVCGACEQELGVLDDPPRR